MTEPEATPETPVPPGQVDLSDLRMMPAWVAGMGGSSNFAKYEEREERGLRPGGRDRREGGPRRDGPPGARRDFGGQGGPRRDGPPGPRRDGPPGQRRDGPPGPRRDRRDGPPRRFDDRPQREWVEIPRDVQVVIEPRDSAAEALAGHIRASGHAFSMFDAARLVLADPERFQARFSCAPERAQGLFQTTADGGLFLSRDEALAHVLRGPALESYYRVEEIELEEPKGDFKSIAVCGYSGELLAPPNHHSFQTALIRLHRERFANLALEDYKRRVRIETSPEIVAQWKEQQRKGHRWVHAREAEGVEPAAFSNRAEMEAHFRRFHGDAACAEVREAVFASNADKTRLSQALFLLLRQAVDTARKHLFEMSQKLGGGFERRGLKLFKRRAGKLFVSRVKPRAVDPGVVFSERVARIVELLKTAHGLPLTELVEKIVPTAAPGPDGTKPPISDEQVAVIKDVRWLANEGYVIEYSDGMIFLGVQGEPAKPKAEVPVAPAVAASAGETVEANPAELETKTEAGEAVAAAPEVRQAESEVLTDVAATGSQPGALAAEAELPTPELAEPSEPVVEGGAEEAPATAS